MSPYSGGTEGRVQSDKDNQSIYESNEVIELAVLTVLGGREEQQDCFGYALKDNEGLIVVCDGMGGHRGGRLASRLAVSRMLSAYEQMYPSPDPAGMMIETSKKIDTAIREMTDESGSPVGGGSTMVAVHIRGQSLIWCSVGDSRGYLFRDGQFVQFTQDQNYQTVLDEKLRTNLITEEEYEAEKKRGGALISYLGIGDLKLIDYNSSPLPLKSGDRIIIMSDGLYKLVPDDEIRAVAENFKNISDAVDIFEVKAAKAARQSGVSRDNMTAAIIKVK